MPESPRAEFATELHIIEGDRRIFLRRWAEHTASLPDHAPIVWPSGYTRDEAEDALYDEFWRRLRAAHPQEANQIRADLALKLGQGRGPGDHADRLASLLVTVLLLLGGAVAYLLSR